MDNLLKVVVLGFLGVIAGLLIFNILKNIVGLLLPFVILGAVGYGIYKLTRPNSLGGGRGGILP